MAVPVYGDRVQETFTTTGTGTISLGGAVTGYQAFSSVVANNATCFYAATDGTNWEVGLGTYTTSGDTLARTTILASSNSNAAVSWSAGTKNIWLDFPAIIAGVAQNNITGCLVSSLAGTHTTATLSVSSGQASDSTGSVYINSAGYSWAASNGNAINGTDASSSTLANSTTYHVFLCTGASGTGTFVSASLTPTFPSGYANYYRRIGSFVTNASGAPLPYTSIEIQGGGTINWLGTQTLDVSTASTSTSSSRTLYTLNVPSGIKVQVLARGASGTSSDYLIWTSGDEADVAPNSGAAVPGTDGYGQMTGVANGWVTLILTTNTSGQVGGRSNTTSQTLLLTTRGWIDFRRN